jgi:hypothetical protein
MRWLIVWFILLGSIQPCSAIKVTSFIDNDFYWDRGKDIIVARCLVPPDKSEKRFLDGVRLVDVDVVKTLKGTSTLGNRKIATIYEMQPGKTYLLYSLGGSVGGTDFLAVAELSVVEVPPGLSLSALDEKPPKEQIAAIFSARLQYLQQIMKQLEEEKVLLEKATTPKSP